MRRGQATTWDSLGCIHRKLADFEQAIACHHNSVETCRKIGDRYWEARALVNFGDTYEAAGDAAAAATVFHDATMRQR